MKSAIVVPSLIKKSRPDKGKSRLPPANISTSRGISSSDYFARSGSGPVSPPPEYDSLPRRRPSSINYASFAGSMAAGSAGGGSGSGGGTPTRMHSRASSSGSIVRAVSTNPPIRVGGVRGSTSTIRGLPTGDRRTRGSVSTSEAEEVVEEEIVVGGAEEIVAGEMETVGRTLGERGGVGLIRTISSSSTTGSDWATDQGSPIISRPPNNRRETRSDSQHSSPLIPSASSFSPRETGSIFANYEGFNSTVSPSMSLTEFTTGGPIGESQDEDVGANSPTQKFAREASTPKLTTGLLSPALELAQMFRDTGPDDGDVSAGVGDTSWEMVPDDRSESPISTLSNPTFGRLEPREATTRRASYREPEEEDSAATPSGERQFSFAQAIRDGPPISPPPLHTSNSSRSISSLHSSPPPSPRTAAKRWSITGVGALFNRGNFVPSEVSPTTLLPPSTSAPSGLSVPSTSTAPSRESREDVRTSSSMDLKRKPVPTTHETPFTLPASSAMLGEDHGHNLVSLLLFRLPQNFVRLPQKLTLIKFTGKSARIRQAGPNEGCPLSPSSRNEKTHLSRRTRRRSRRTNRVVYWIEGNFSSAQQDVRTASDAVDH